MILLIWHYGAADYEIRLYACEENSRMAELAIASAGKYINSDDLPEDHPIFELNDILECDEDYCSDAREGPFSKAIVLCGFVE